MFNPLTNVQWLCIVSGWLVSLDSSVDGHTSIPSLLLISFDGFRWDYLDKVKASGRSTPNFDKFASHGVRAKYVKNSYVTKTFPNHYTIVTGLYEENHGVVGNNMYDPVLNERFTNSDTQKIDANWWNNGTEDWPGDPIWLRNERDAENSLATRRSGVYFWPGSAAPIRGKHPTHYKHYDSSVPYDARINQVVDWFRDDAEPINLGVLYFEEPDRTGHRLGPDDPEILDVIVKLDGYVGMLIEQLEANHLIGHVNVIITSDHGMVHTDKFIFLEDYVNVTLFDVYGGTPVLQIRPKPGQEDEVYRALSNITNAHVYRKQDIPSEYRYRNNRRVQPIIISAAEGFNICVRNNSDCDFQEKGNHGYNNSLPNMHPFFLARGPAFKRGYAVEMFRNVDIYPLMCSILDIEPAQHDGSLHRVRDLLATHDNSTMTLVTYLLVMAFAATVSGLMTVAVLRVQRYHRHRQYGLRKSLSLNNVYVDASAAQTDGHTHLLVSDEEEIP